MDLIWSVFPKFFQSLTLDELAELVAECGLDTANLVIRDGYWVEPHDLETGTRRFVQAMSRHGIRVHFATAGFTPEQIVRDDTLLAVLADSGITDFRMSYFPRPGDGCLRAAFDAAHRQLTAVARACERRGIRAVYQFHHGTLVPNSAAFLHVIRDIPHTLVGAMLDPGNQSFEGSEDWVSAARFLDRHLVAMGVKDTAVWRDLSQSHAPGKGWHRAWVPVDQGVVHWGQVLAGLRTADFRGTLVFMPFYDSDCPDRMRVGLKREVAYLRALAEALD